MILLVTILFWFAVAWLLYVVIGYPLVMMLLAKIRPRPLERAPGYQPSICFVMAAYNEERCIGERLENYLALDYPRHLLSFQIGSDASTDATDRIIESHSANDPSIMLTRFNRVGKTQIIYELAAKVTADIIVFTDADILLAPNGLRVIVDCLSDPSVGGVLGTIVYRDPEVNAGNTGQRKYLEIENMLRRSESLFWTTVGPDGECFAVRRGAFDPPEDYRLSDDLNLVISIPMHGKRVWYEPGLTFYESNKRSLGSEYNRRLRMGQQAAATLFTCRATRYPWSSMLGFQLWSHKLLRNLAAIPMALAVISAILLAYESIFHRLAAVVAILFVLALVAGWLGDKMRLNLKALHYPIYFTMMLTSLTIGSMRAVFSGGLEMWNSQRLE